MNTRIAARIGVGAFAVALVGVAAVMLSPDAQSSLAEKWRRWNGHAGQACFDFVRKDLKDPYSARFEGSTPDKKRDGLVSIVYYAKNSFGAYGRGEAECVVGASGVMEEATRSHRELAELGKGLDAEIERLKRKNACLAENIRLLERGNRSDLNCEAVH